MSDSTAPKPATTPVPTPPPAEPVQETDWKAEARKWESRAKENLTAAKANEDAAKRLAEMEEAAKSEAQKQAEALQAAQAELETYRQREQVSAWAKEVAEATGVPADALRGSSKEELEAHAEQLKSLGVGQAPARTPNPVPTIGMEPKLHQAVTIDQQIAAAEKAGDWDMAGRLKAIKLGTLSANTR